MCIEEKETNIRETSERLYRKRYLGECEIDSYMYKSFIKDGESEINKFINTFICAGMPEKKEILFTRKLIEELQKVAKSNNVELSTLINCYLLQMLERNKETRVFTKARKVYIDNNLYERSEYIKRCESKERIRKNIFSDDFIKYGQISFSNTTKDEETYIKNFLLNKGYSVKEIKKIESEEKQTFGTVKTKEGRVMNPIEIVIDMCVINNKTGQIIDALNFKDTHYTFIPTRLGFHYMILNDKKLELNNYQDIENYLNRKLKGGKKVWDLYKEYLELNPIPMKNQKTELK